MKLIFLIFFAINISWIPKPGDYYEFNYTSKTANSHWKHTVKSVNLETNQFYEEIVITQADGTVDKISLWKEIEKESCIVTTTNSRKIRVSAGVFNVCKSTEVGSGFERSIFQNSATKAPFVKMEVTDQNSGMSEVFELKYFLK